MCNSNMVKGGRAGGQRRVIYTSRRKTVLRRPGLIGGAGCGLFRRINLFGAGSNFVK